jgi:hypothetical protein
LRREENDDDERSVQNDIAQERESIMSITVDPLPLPPPLFGGSTSTLVAAVTGINTDGGPGVSGTSALFDAVVGETRSDAHAGVTGRNLTTGANGGVGIYGVGGK